jgi:hypothetical protein
MNAPEKCPNCNIGGKSNEWQPSRRWYYHCGTYVYADKDRLKVSYVGDLCHARMCANELRKELNAAREQIKGWENKWRCAVEMAALAMLKLDID